MNIIDIQDQLKNFSEKQLVSEMQSPTGSAPQFLVLSEIKRRKRVRDDFAKREAAQQPTVAQEAVASAGVPQSGIAGMAEAMAPKSTMVQKAMRSGGLMQFGAEIQRGLAEKAQNEQIEPFLDEVEQMAQTEFGIDSASFGAGMRPMPTNIRPITPSAGLPSLSPFGATKTGGKGGAMLGMNRMASLRAQSNPVAEPQVMPSPVQKYDEGGVVRAANGLPLGLRQNNPGNIRPGAGFIGETGQSGGYAEFGSEEEGLRALARLLGTYSDKHGINTLRGFTSRYAPRSDNRDSFDNYVSYLSDRLGMDPDQEFDLKSMRGDLIPAIVGFEQGREYGDRYSDDQISRAITAAGTDDEAAVRNALFGVNPRDVSTTQSEPASLYERRSPGRGATPTETVPEAAAFSGYPSQKGITSPPVSESNQEDSPVKIPPLYGDGWVTSKADYDEYVRDSRNLQQDEILNPWQYENLQRGEYLYDVLDEDLVGTQYESLMGSEGLDITVAGAAQNQQMSTSPVDVADTAFPNLAEESAQKAVEVADILNPQTQEAATNVGKASVEAEKVVGEDATVEQVAEAAGEILKEENNTAGTALAPVEEEEGPDAPPPAPRGPSINVGGEAETFEAGTLASEIKALQDKLDKDRETDKYLALAQAGLALMSSKEPTLLGAVGEAGISGLTAFREAQDRYQEGVIDLINARAKLKSKTGSAFTRNQMIQRAKDLQAMATTATENGNIQRARELTIAANTLLSQAGLIEGGGINEAFADQ